MPDGSMDPATAEIKAVMDAQISGMRNTLLKEFADVHEVLDEMKTEMGSISKSISATREITNSIALGSVAASATRKTFNPVVAAQIHSADLFLRSEMLSAVTISSVCKYLTSSSPLFDDSQVLEAVRLILFAPGAHTRKKARRTDLGRKFMDLRVKIVLNMVYNCQAGVRKECLSLLRPFLPSSSDVGANIVIPTSEMNECEISRASTSVDGMRSTVTPFRPPAWTEKGFIARSDVDMAVGELVKQEVEDGKDSPSPHDGLDVDGDGRLVQTQLVKRRRTSNTVKLSVREEISREIVKHMWKRWTDWFGNSRNEARKSFTLDIGVVFLEPTSRWKPMTSCNSVEDYFDLIKTVQDAEPNSVFRANFESITSNLRVFKEMLNSFPNFLVACQYSVEVFENVEDMAQNTGGQEMTLRRTVNLLQVAANFLTAYFQVSSLDVVLGGSRNSLRLIFIVALCFAGVVDRASRPRVGKNGRELVCSEAKELGLLIPGDAGRLHFITEKCLRMRKEKFDSLNSTGYSESGSDRDGASRGEIGSDDEEVENVFM